MKNLFVLFLCFLVLPVFAYSSKASKFAETAYAKTNNGEKFYINMKKEYSIEYQQKPGETIVYGWGDMRGKYRGKYRRKKCRITYVVLTDKSGNPYWSKINVYK